VGVAGVAVPTVIASLLCGGSVLALSISGATVLSGGGGGGTVFDSGVFAADGVGRGGARAPMDDTITGSTRLPVLRPPGSVVAPAPRSAPPVRDPEPMQARIAEPAVAIVFVEPAAGVDGSARTSTPSTRHAVPAGRRVRPAPGSAPSTDPDQAGPRGPVVPAPVVVVPPPAVAPAVAPAPQTPAPQDKPDQQGRHHQHPRPHSDQDQHHQQDHQQDRQDPPPVLLAGDEPDPVNEDGDRVRRHHCNGDPASGNGDHGSDNGDHGEPGNHDGNHDGKHDGNHHGDHGSGRGDDAR
jgi:hypothetical protein